MLVHQRVVHEASANIKTIFFRCHCCGDRLQDMTGIKQELEDICIVIQNSRPFSDTGRLVTQGVSTLWKEKIILVGGLELFFPYVRNNDPNWLIFFRGVETTNQNPSLTWGLICLPSVLHNGTGLSYTRISREGTPLCHLWISADHLVHPVLPHGCWRFHVFFVDFWLEKRWLIYFWWTFSWMDWHKQKQSCMAYCMDFKWFQDFALPRCLFPWPTAPRDDQCSKDSLESASPCPMSMFRWICWRPGSIC